VHPIDLPPEQDVFLLIDVCRLARVRPGTLREWASQFEQIETRQNDSGELFFDRQQTRTVLELRRLLIDEGLSVEAARRQLATETPVTRKGEPTTEHPRKVEKRAHRTMPSHSDISTEVRDRLAPVLSMVHSVNAGAARLFGIHDTWH